MTLASKKQATLADKLKKSWRGLQREMSGESRRALDLTTSVAKGSAQGTTYQTETVRLHPLQFERTEAFVQGPAKAVHRIRCLDTMIGKLSKPFNGAARVPDDIVDLVTRHVADLENDFKQVSAVTCNHEKSPVRYLEFVNKYPTNTGGTVEQRLARIKLG